MEKHFSYTKWKIRELQKNTFLHKRNVEKLKMPSIEMANNYIIDALNSKEPFCLLRPGKCEYGAVMLWDEHILFGTKRYQDNNLFRTLGYRDKEFERWVNWFKKDLNETDILAMFFSRAIEEGYLAETYTPHAKLIWMEQLESFYHIDYMEHTWTDGLEGKNVLVINPFVEAMEKQYKYRKEIWNGKNVLPQMNLRFLKSVWYIDENDNSGFDNWFEALDYLLEEIGKIDFDIALVSCGPFSSFLATEIKRQGKKAIQYGGSLQILFGIRGKRWDRNIHLKNYYNDYWVRADKQETPRNTVLLDNGDYW